MTIQHSKDFKQLIAELQIDYTPAEFLGFLSGLTAGGIQDESWKTLTYQFTNDGHAFSVAPLAKLTAFYQNLAECFDQADTRFALWLPENEDDAFALADGIYEWTGHFILGLGLAQPTLQNESDEIGEIIDDLNEIAKLGYSENDDNDELLDAAEEIVDYLQVATLLLHNHFAVLTKSGKPQLH